MKYKITKQYAQDIETLIAEFKDLEDAKFFIERKLISNPEKIIYRLFDDQKKLKEFNIEKINSVIRIRPGQYADEDQYLPDSFGQYKVSKDNVAANAHAAFIESKDAELFVEDKLTHTNTTITYYIFNKDQQISQLNQFVKKQIDSEAGSKGKDQSASFNPTPFNTTPLPLGIQRSGLKDEKKDKN